MQKYIKSALIIAVIASSFSAIAVQTIPSASAQGQGQGQGQGRTPSCEAARQEHTPLSTPAYDTKFPQSDECSVNPAPHSATSCGWSSGDPEEVTKAFLNALCAKQTPPSP